MQSELTTADIKQVKSVNGVLKSKSGKTCIELKQAINNLTIQNNSGQYTERIANYENELLELQNEVLQATRNFQAPKHEISEMEMKAIMLFNSDRRFSITE